MSDPAPESWIVEVRARLASPPARRLPTGSQRPASVLVPLFVDARELWVLLTRRSEELPHHRGQIAFPGGGLEIGEDPWQAALRETREEVGLETERVLELGSLDEVETPSGYRIVPCVGALPQPFEARPNADEIAEVFSIPIRAFADPRLVEQRQVELDGVIRDLTIYHVGRRRIWGVTAEILTQLLARLKG